MQGVYRFASGFSQDDVYNSKSRNDVGIHKIRVSHFKQQQQVTQWKMYSCKTSIWKSFCSFQIKKCNVRIQAAHSHLKIQNYNVTMQNCNVNTELQCINTELQCINTELQCCNYRVAMLEFWTLWLSIPRHRMFWCRTVSLTWRNCAL